MATESNSRKRAPSGDCAGGSARARVELSHLREQLRHVRGSRGQLGAQLPWLSFTRVGPQRLHPGPVGRCAARLPAAPGEHLRPALVGAHRELLRQAALADPWFPAHKHEPSVSGSGVGERRQQLAEVVLAAHERAGRSSPHTRGRPLLIRPARRVEGGVLDEDRLLHRPQLATGFETELVDQPAPGLAVGLQRVGLAAAAVERQHQLAAQALAKRVFRDQGLELTDQLRMASQFEVGGDPILQGTESAAPPAWRSPPARTPRT